jgi:hypothetical protein
VAGEDRELDDREAGQREIDRRQAAQAVEPEQQPAIVVAIGKPTSEDGADEIEDADDGKWQGGADRRNAEIAAMGRLQEES